MQKQTSDDEGHDQVRPTCLRPRDKQGGNDDGDIAKRVVATEQPYRAHIGVAMPVW